MRRLTNFFLLFVTAYCLTSAQSVVVNKYFNSGASNGVGDIVELLVVQNNLDMRGMIIKDFSSNMANDGGGKFEFRNVTLWQNLQSGTLLVLRNDTSAVDINSSDFTLDVGLKNTSFFISRGGTFDIAITDMVMIKSASSDTTGTGVVGSIHVLAGGTAGTQFTAASEPKLRATGTSPTGKYIFAKNSTSSLIDFNGTDADSTSSAKIWGQGNNTTNSTYISTLRGTPPNTKVQFTSSGQTYGENAGAVLINVSITNPSPTNATTVDAVITGGTATFFTDYLSPSTTIPLTFPAGSSNSASISIYINDDSEIESDETIIFTLQNVSGGTNAEIGSPSTFTLTIEDNDTPVPFLTIAEAREDLNIDLIPDKIGQTVKLRGVVIGPNYQTTNFSYYIQQGNAGINIFRAGTTLPSLMLGDSVEITGVIGQFRGLTQISHSSDGDLIKLGTGTIPSPVTMTFDEYKGNPEAYESVLIKFNNVNKSSGTWPAAGNSATIVISQGTEVLDLRIDSDTDIDDNPEPVWPRNITGIGSQFSSSTSTFNDGYQLLPRYYTDFEPATSVKDQPDLIPDKMKLYQNYPNPFNPQTSIEYSVPSREHVTLKIYDVLGREVAVLINEIKEIGNHKAIFSIQHSELTAGVYLYQLNVGSNIATKKMVLMK